MAIDTGTRFGHYNILSPLGAGGMGEVYLAEDTRLRRKVALKLLPEAFTRNMARVRRFEQEARTASALNHPNILTIHEIGQVDGAHFIVTEFIDGQTLRQRMQTAKLSLSEVVDVAIQVAQALAAAHAVGIVHRDIKPENVMVRPDGLVKVLDFGLAKLTETKSPPVDSEASTLAKLSTEPGVRMGTVSYMSPEQARGEDVDHRSDIFSLGVTLYEMIAGCRPFEGRSAADVIASILSQEPTPIARFLPEAPGELQWIVNKALRKGCDERYQTAKELLSDLKEVKEELEIQAKLKRRAAPEVSKEADEAAPSGLAADRKTLDASAEATGEKGALTTSSAQVILNEIKRHKRGATLIGVALILVLGSAGYGVYRFVYQSDPNVAPSQTTRITATGNATDAAISPDGKYVAYVDGGRKQQSLWVKQLATGSILQIVPPAEVMYFGLTFSNDGAYIYYDTVMMGSNDPSGELYRVPSIGGPTKKLIENIDSCVTFSPDGQRFAFVRRDYAKLETSLMIANADGAIERTLVTRKYPNLFVSMEVVRIAWSPDGKIVACPVMVSGGAPKLAEYSVVGVSVEDGSEKALTSHRWEIVDQVAWLSNSSLAALANDEGHSRQLWRISSPGGEAHKLTNDSNKYAGISLARDSGTLVTVVSNSISNIQIAAKGDLGRANQITYGIADGARGLSWTPDGRIVYVSLASGSRDIWIMNADGSNQRQLTHDGSNFNPSVSSDGRYIVYSSCQADKCNIWRMNVDGSNSKQLTDGMWDSSAQISPDGRWVVYGSSETNYADKMDLRKAPIDGGASVQLTEPAEHAGCSAISPNGKHIASYYWDQQVNPPDGVMILLFEGGQRTKRFKRIVGENHLECDLHWAPDGSALMYIDNSLSNILSQSINGGDPVRATNFQGEQIFNFDWSRDGKWLALARGRIMNDVYLIRDFK